MAQPTLDERFHDGPPRRGPNETHNWLTAEERRFILWGLKERWPAVRMGRALGVNEATVRRFRRGFWAEPILLLELGLLAMVGKARGEEYRCLVCGDHVVTRSAAERHVLAHYVDESVVEEALKERSDREQRQT